MPREKQGPIFQKGDIMHFFRRAVFPAVLALAVSGLLYAGTVQAAPRIQETGERTVIVIDPGHGGENRGTIENGHEEKYMTMTTALAMYEELLLYEDVDVYLTHREDADMSLKERAEFAKSVNADFMFSIHYNASASHELFGSEVWVSSVSPYNSYGYQFGYEFLTDMRDLGLFVRGIKTRLGNGGADYYGIIRQSVALDIPAVILEHCHVDEARDAVFCDTEEQLKAFGRMDATAVARYFGLKSSVLGVDYSDYALAAADPSGSMEITAVDTTVPELCVIDYKDADYEEGILELTVSAMDPDSLILYYSYSLDGGRTFSAREPWPGSDALTGSFPESFPLKLTIPPDTAPTVILRAYNLYDLYVESNSYISEQVFRPAPVENGEQPAENSANNRDIQPVLNEAAGQERAPEEGALERYDFVVFCLAFAVAILILLFFFQYVSYRKRKKRRVQRRKELGELWNQQK